jgi:hypothetical protein
VFLLFSLPAGSKGGTKAIAAKGLNGKGQNVVAVEIGKSGIAACTGH